MAANRVIHPSADVLQAFALGKLNDSAASVVISHLDSCPDCCNQVAELSGDDFLQRLRQAHGRGSTPAPVKSLSDDPYVTLPPGQTLIPNPLPELANNPQYEIVRELGRGGMGVVYLAKNKLMDRLEVLKVVNKKLLDHPGAVERFLREIRSAAKLSHANVVTAYSAVQQGELLAFAMEYVEGQDLASLVKTQGPLPVAHACYYVQQAALGLQHAYEEKMVHRDIKPQNLILTHKGKKHIVKVLDFGLAKVMREKSEDTGLTGEGRMLGTPDYIAPEQALDAAKADIRADIYSLGGTLYYLLSGRPPFGGNSLGAVLLAHQTQEAKPLNLVRPEVPEELAAIVRKMMAKSPAKRYQTPREVVQALAPFVKQGGALKSAPELSSGIPRAAVVKPVTPEAPSPAITSVKSPPVPEPAHPVACDTLIEGSISSTQPPRSGAVRERRPASRATEIRKKWLIGGLGMGVLLLALLGMWMGGVFNPKTKYGTIVLENLPADAEVTVDGDRVTFDAGDGKPVEVRVATGTKHQLHVKKDGFKVFGQEVEIDAEDRRVIRVSLQPEPVANKPPQPATEPASKPPSQESATARKPPAPAPRAPVEKSFLPLFNGQNLIGWRTHPKQRGYWRVQKGILIGSGPAISHLFSSRGDYKDFHLRVEARINDGGNSGVFFRAPFGIVWPANKPLFPTGYEAKINSTHPDYHKTGSLVTLAKTFEEVTIRESPVPYGKWFMMEVIAIGNHIVVKVDGITKVDYKDAKRHFTSGHIALLQRDSQTVAEFRKIEIKELSTK